MLYHNTNHLNKDDYERRRRRRLNRSRFEENHANRSFVSRDIMTRRRKYSSKERARPDEHYHRTTLSPPGFALHYYARNGCNEASPCSMQFLGEAKTLFVVFTGKICRGGSCTRTNGPQRMQARCLRSELHRRPFFPN